MPARSLHGFLNPSPPARSTFWILSPLIGSVVFIILYVIAARYYPGGSQADVHAKGFSWQHNYWCNLLNTTGMNGEMNTARGIAIAAMIVLLISLFSFWCIAAQLLFSTLRSKAIIISAGFLSVVVLAFLSTTYHDTVINLSGFFGLIAMAGCYAGIYRAGWRGLFAFGILNVVLLALNNYLYYTNRFFYLPLVQKVTFLSFLVWICAVDWRLYKRGATERA